MKKEEFQKQAISFKKLRKYKLTKRVGRQIPRESPSEWYFGPLTWLVWKCRVKHKSKHLATESDQLRYLDLSQTRSQNLHVCNYEKTEVVTTYLIR